MPFPPPFFLVLLARPRSLRVTHHFGLSSCHFVVGFCSPPSAFGARQRNILLTHLCERHGKKNDGGQLRHKKEDLRYNVLNIKS